VLNSERPAISVRACRFRFDNYIQYRLAYAFVLAAVGRRHEASEQFDMWWALHDSWLSDSVMEQLRKELDAVSVLGLP
jgi:hypothetical protein